MIRRSVAVLATATLLAVAMATPTAAREQADVCLEFGPGELTAHEWDALTEAVSEAVAARPALFPAPVISRSDTRLEVASDHAATSSSATSGCLQPSHEWTSWFGRGFLEAGAEQLLAEAPTTPGIASDVSIEWYPRDRRLRTVLTFAGPLDIPNGTCWVDDALAIEAGKVTASGEQGLRTSPFAEGACGRFFDHLPDGGAGEQAVTLLPAAVDVHGGGVLTLVAETVTVSDGGLMVAGRIERAGS